MSEPPSYFRAPRESEAARIMPAVNRMLRRTPLVPFTTADIAGVVYPAGEHTRAQLDAVRGAVRLLETKGKAKRSRIGRVKVARSTAKLVFKWSGQK